MQQWKRRRRKAKKAADIIKKKEVSNITESKMTEPQPTISASLIVKNESSCIRKSLESIKGVDEIIIVDTGSTDNTIEIAKEYTDKVYYGEEYLWRDNFAFSRNQSLDLCTKDWVLIIDADEHLEKGGMEKIRNIIKDCPKDAVYFNTVANNNKNYIHQSIRLFKRGEIRWGGAIHNYLSTTDAIKSDITLYYGYSAAHQLDPDRAFRILKKEYEFDPNTGRTNYYLAREYWYRKDYENAAKHYKQCTEHSKWNPELADALLMLARCYWHLQRGNEAREVCSRAVIINPDFKEALEFMAEIHFEPWKHKWLEFAKLAKNENVLFIRSK